MYLYVCSNCCKPLAELRETRKADGLVKYSYWRGGGFDKITKALQNDVLYTSLDVNKYYKKKPLTGGCMGLIQQSGRSRVFWR